MLINLQPSESPIDRLYSTASQKTEKSCAITDCSDSTQSLGVIRDFAGTSSVEFFEGLFEYNFETKLPIFVEILKKSEKVNRVDVDVDLGWSNNNSFRDSFRAACAQLIEILQIETMKRVKFVMNYRWTDMDYKCSLNLDLLKSCLGSKKWAK